MLTRLAFTSWMLKFKAVPPHPSCPVCFQHIRPSLPHSHCTASPLASFLHLTDSKDSLCSPCSNGCGASHSIETDLLGDTGLKKTDSSSPSSHQMSVAPQLEVEAGECSLLHAGMLTGVILCRQPQQLSSLVPQPVMSRCCLSRVLADRWCLQSLYCG